MPAPLSLPNDVAVQMESNEPFLYVVLNGNNQLAKIRFADRTTVWTAPVGVAPFGVALAGNRAFVTNWGGPKPDLNRRQRNGGCSVGQCVRRPKNRSYCAGNGLGH